MNYKVNNKIPNKTSLPTDYPYVFYGARSVLLMWMLCSAASIPDQRKTYVSYMLDATSKHHYDRSSPNAL